jgi:hypothetical protein
MYWERAKNGIQLTNHRGIIVCVLGQSLFLYLHFQWMFAVADAALDHHHLVTSMLVAAGIGASTIILTNVIRAYVFLSQSCDIAKFDSAFFEPSASDLGKQQ